MFDPTKQPSKERVTTPASMNLPGQCFMLLFKCHFKSCANGKETVLAVRDGFTVVEVRFTEDLKGQPDPRDFAKGA